ncbi:ubiquinol-cytochrome c reductase iron-sulfur subunit [Polynucleobacter paneuropaeus]|uniref:ubiquinol-cytochrome c reductase iron-sulfur subunit n=1 Tax=Polynucleobacter sp. MWH-P3-07-1 TaxID=1743173 RepID=UPI001BFD276E|nr:ubiquinol-cytochrome c reductase iron-sulfur subunit [Polynucleobacter sp. MWH-P3-07-1]MBT8537351.1 ubiquinol-cytochrome c reductase iron-sulfur subunit [Polynucleobacter paneuropaeus]QWD93381.1 ubiquinol-cytochrome c reductase iron-sulfur subunit [Polynucleobacter asymbioticus]QWC97000.1 ubiquinol-cytochrome c reductase iron-sulfur subunit [Polynucleobacter paneuropaeus]QWD09307.1 ubiquinol-cytochrome c reductase iron-sulfur subunit [Polynucleobacter paneuropaeus]QWD11062.1 ubiquinol-cytoc
MSDKPSMDKDRRNWLIATSAVGGVGAAAALYPFIDSFEPSERAKAAGAAVEIDITGMKPDEMRTIEWRGKPVWVIRRTEAQLAELPQNDSNLADPESKRNQDALTPPYARNEWRSIKPEYLVVVGICTHLGCSPSAKFDSGPQPSLPNNWPGGFLCPCHGSTFDMAGRVYKNKPAPDNLEVPPHMYLSDTKILIGDDKKA